MIKLVHNPITVSSTSSSSITLLSTPHIRSLKGHLSPTDRTSLSAACRYFMYPVV